MKRKPAKRAFTIEDAKSEILAKLAKVEGKGKRSIYTAKTNPEKRDIYLAARDALEETSEIRLQKDLGKWYLAVFAPPEPSVENVAAKLLHQSADLEVDLFDLRALTKKLSSREKMFAVSSLELLVRQGHVMELSLKVGSVRRFLYANAAAFASRLNSKGETLESKAKPDENGAADELTIRYAYDDIVRTSHFPDVAIGSLHDATGVPLSVLKAWIRGEHANGRATLSFGDWSLASESRRAAAIEIDGERYLFVRLVP